MSTTAGLCIFVCFLISIVAEVEGVVSSPPSNAMAEVTGEAIFNCSATPSGPLLWVLTRDGIASGEIRITTFCTVNASLQNHYRTEQPGGPTTCNLIVFNITMEEAGVYHCTDTDAYRALLTVIEKSPTTTYNKTENVVVENENVIITCSLNYNGSVSPATTLRPYFYWKNFTGHNVNSSNDWTTDNTAVSQITITPGRGNIAAHTCFVYLQLTPSTNPSYASNTPTINKSVISPTIEVLYNASTPIIVKNIACETITLTCDSSGNPPPKYKWSYLNKTVNVVISEEQILTLAKVNQSYICEAYNTIRKVSCTTSTNYNASESESGYSSSCRPNNNNAGTTNLITTIVPAAVLGGYGLCNIIATIVFLVYYNRKSNTVSDDKEMSKFKNKSKLNAQFPWLQRMLPCMNESRGNAGCTFLCVILFIFMSILAGIIVFPILVAMVNCSRKRNDTKEISDIGMSNQKRSKTAGNPSTAAHGDFEDPYDEINTIRHDRKHTLEEPTSAKNTKDAKKVFYTRVNPNLNTEEDIERYAVSMPSGNPES